MSTPFKVVTICGSMTLLDDMLKVASEETSAGRIVHIPFPAEGSPAEHRALHHAKIDLSDGIVVVTRDGRIGESASDEIEYAERTGKTVRYAEDSAGWVDYPAASSDGA